MKNFFKLAASIALTFSAGLFGSLFTGKNIPVWYAGLNKPVFNPPNWLFGPVWTLLYIMMGVSLFLVWKTEKNGKWVAVWIFIAQLILNALWSYLFFENKLLFLSFLEIIILWGLIVMCVVMFRKINKTAAYLLVPYLMWTGYASILNFAIWRLN